MDPKYRWLWEKKDGVVYGDPDKAVELSNVLELVDMDKVDKGKLHEPKKLVDLEAVEARQSFIKDGEVDTVGKVGSKRVVFEGCDLLFSKLEPYLAKVLTDWPDDAIGSPEWVGLKILKEEYDPTLLSYYMMLPEACEAYRCLKSGKRHARLDKKELLELKFEFPGEDEIEEVSNKIQNERGKIEELRNEVKEVRSSIDENIKSISEESEGLGISNKIDPR